MDTIIVILLIAVISCLLFVATKLGKNNASTEKADDIRNTYLQNELMSLRQQVGELSNSLNQTINARMDKTQTSVQEQLKQSSEIVRDVSARLARLDETNKRVVDVATELKTLQNVLSNPKQRGVFGEFYLNSILENVFAPNQWQPQYKFADGQIVDAVIFLDKNRILPIDSKFSLENYNRFIECEDKAQKAKLLALVKSDLKGRIDETSKYIRPNENTMDFAFMFIPSESLYYDLLVGSVGQGGSSRDLIEYAFRDKHVIITSPTSFMAYLETVLQGLRSLQIEEQARDIQKRVAQLGTHIAKYDEYLQKMGNSLSTTVNHYNNAYKEFAKVDKDITRISADATPERKPIDTLSVDRPNRGE